MSALGRLGEEVVQGEPEVRRRLEPSQPERVHQHQPADPVAIDRRRSGPRWRRPARSRPAAGGDGQVCSISSPSQASTRAASIGPSSTSDEPWPGRSGAITRWVAASCGITHFQWTALPPGPCSRTTGGPSPPPRTAVERPARRSRRSVTGTPASNRSRSLFTLCSWIIVASRTLVEFFRHHVTEGPAPPRREKHPYRRVELAWVILCRAVTDRSRYLTNRPHLTPRNRGLSLNMDEQGVDHALFAVTADVAGFPMPLGG